MANVYDKQRAAADAYLKSKQIPELLSHLLELVAYAQPDDPRAFILGAIKKLQDRQPDCLFADDELTTMYDMIDVTKQKHITVTQLRNAYANLGGGELKDSMLPEPARTSGKVDVECFKAVIGERLRTKNVWC